MSIYAIELVAFRNLAIVPQVGQAKAEQAHFQDGVLPSLDLFATLDRSGALFDLFVKEHQAVADHVLVRVDPDVVAGREGASDPLEIVCLRGRRQLLSSSRRTPL